MTSLIDVIFLLLLFFMLTSTFSKFSEVELASAGAGTVAPSGTPPLFLQLGPETVRLNGDFLVLDRLAVSPLGNADQGMVVLVSLEDGVDAQRLTDLLVALRGVPGLRVSILGV